MAEPAKILAQFNIATARWPFDDPRMAGFFDAVPAVNALAERSEGYIWRLKDEHGPDAPEFGPEYGDLTRMTLTLSAWRDLESLRAFTWNTIHKRFRMRNAEWFEPHNQAYLAIWPIPADHRPNGNEALARLEQLRREGPSEAVFGVETLSEMATS